MFIKKHFTYIIISIFLIALYITLYQKIDLKFQKKNMKTHADILSVQMWDFNLSSMNSYINLICKRDSYREIEITGETGHISETYTYQSHNAINNILLRIGLIPEIIIESDILHNGEKIADIKGKWNPTWIYTHLYVLMLYSLVSLVFFLFRKTLQTKQHLEFEVKNRTKELEDTRHYLHCVINSMQSIIVGINDDNRIAMISNNVEDQFSISSEECIGKLVTEIFIDFNISTELEKARTTTKPVYKRNIKATNGKIYNIIISQLIEENSNIVITIDDVTIANKLQDKILQAQKMDSIGNLVGGIAHDFNNVLSGIVGSISLLKLQLQKEILHNKEKIDSSINIISKSSKRASDMVEQLLSFSRKHNLAKRPVSISSIINQVIKLCNNSFPKTVDITVSSNSDLYTIADETQLNQVLLNLCINGMHAMTIMKQNETQGGTLHISTESESHDVHPKLKKGIRYTKITIKDSGIGIAEKDKNFIFDPFFTTKKDVGSGLGLAMAYNIIDKFDGVLDFTSTVGKGTEFYIYLPQCDAPIPDAVEKVNEISTKIDGLILIVDDEEIIRDIASSILEEIGLRVITADSGTNGEKLFRERYSEIDYLLLDFSMPGMSGLEFYKRIYPMADKLETIVSSGNIDDFSKQEFQKMGVTSFMNKPYNYKMLVSEIKALHNQHSHKFF